MNVFKLPDLGEGLAEAEIVQWHVSEGDAVENGQVLVSVETAKAIVEVPSPRAGQVEKLFAKPGDIVQTGERLVGFAGAQEDQENASLRENGQKRDTGTVVGEVQVGEDVVSEQPAAVGHAGGGIRATPAVRALARRLDVDLSVVTPSGPDGLITAADVQRVAKLLADTGPLEPLRGARRSMARSLSQAHEEVVAVTVSDDADIHGWPAESDITLRLIRSIVVGCRAEPSLNAWYDGRAIGRRLVAKVHLGIAVDTEDGLFVPVLRDVGARESADLRRGLEALKVAVRERKIPPEELRGYTFTLSNFGRFAGRYADPMVVPPTVAILGAGRVRDAVVPENGKPAVHRVLPLSLTFDHRAVTGGEATRFLAAVIADLETAR